MKLGVRATSFLARVSTLRLPSSFSGRKWTLKTEDLPLMSGGPNRERHRAWGGSLHRQPRVSALPLATHWGRGAKKNDPQVLDLQLFNH